MGSEAGPAVPELITALSDKNAEVRKQATHALGEIGPAAGDAVAALVKQLRDSAKAAEIEAQQAAKASKPGSAAAPNPPGGQ